MSVESNLKESFSDIHSVEANAKINFYSVKYNKRSKNENYAFSLPSEINENILKDICSNLTVYVNQECKALNTTEKPTDAYEYVDLKMVYENWMEISSLITSPSPFNGKEANNKVAMANVGICHMRYLNNDYFMFLKQKSFQKAFQGKSVCYAIDQSLTSLEMYKHGEINDMPQIKRVGLWFVLIRSKHLSLREDDTVCLSEIDMLMLKNRIDQWIKAVRLSGYTPVIYINYRKK